MRLRLFHQVFLLITVSAIFAEIAMGGAYVFNLRRGFQTYLDERDTIELDQFVRASGGVLADHGGRADINSLPSMMGLGQPPPPRQGAEGGPGPPPGAPFGPPPPRSPGAGPPMDFRSRIVIADARGVEIYGPPLRDNDSQRINWRPIRIDSQIIGYAGTLPIRKIATDIDQRFIDGQIKSTLLIALVLFLLGALSAWVIARKLSGSFNAMMRVTTDIAEGKFGSRVREAGPVEVADTMRNINSMATSLQRLESARRRWLAEVSHELRTPLAALRAEIDALCDGVRPLNMKAVRSLREEALRLGALMDDLHFLALSDMSAPLCHPRPANAGEICARAIARFADPAKQASLSLRLQMPEGQDLAVVWDEGRMGQVLANLLSNSLKYTAAGGQVLLSLSRNDAEISIWVEDTAPCPAKDQILKLFEPLYRVEPDRGREVGGSGMGLAVCEAIVRAHLGSITASASVHGGLCIDIRLPVDATTSEGP